MRIILSWIFCFVALNAAANAEIVGPYDLSADAWADELVNSNNTNPTPMLAENVLGKDLETFTGLGSGFMTLRFTDNSVENGIGDDLVIFELRTPETFGVGIGGVMIEVQAAPISVPGNTEPVNAATVDLTDFGLAPGALIDTVTLWATAGSADIAGIAAINVGEPIPSPSSASLSILLVLGVLGRRIIRL